jgi:amidase
MPTRRAFLRTATVGAGAAAFLPALSVAAAKPTKALWPAAELEELSIPELQARMAAGRESSRSLTRKYLARIDAIDRRGPELRSVLEVNPEAMAQAAELDEERKKRGPRGPMHGIPVLLKDNIDTHDRMFTTAGSLALMGSVPLRDAFLVSRLRDAGAVFLGKTNLSEWANFRGSRSTSGWSGRGGQTRNPYYLDRNPSGSSSGSAVAVAASLCAVAVGTETDGSILSPSSYNGIVGIKPTVGLISRSGVIPISASQDTAGPMARTVRDAAILLGALAGTDPRDDATASAAQKRLIDYTAGLSETGLRGARLGIVRPMFGSHAGANKVAETAIDALKQQGATVLDVSQSPARPGMREAEHIVLLYEFKAGLNAYLAALGPRAPQRSLADVIEFNQRHREKELPWFGQETFIAAEAKGPLTEPEYLEALATSRRLSRKEGIDALIQEHKLDALVAPTTGPAHVTDYVHGDRGSGSSTSPAAVSGYPSITVPAGFVSGLPVGLSFFGPAWSEPALLRLAYAFEQATRFRRSPRFVPSLVS